MAKKDIFCQGEIAEIATEAMSCRAKLWMWGVMINLQEKAD